MVWDLNCQKQTKNDSKLYIVNLIIYLKALMKINHKQ